MIDAGMNVARLNFSHGDFASHGEVIKKIRAEGPSPEHPDVTHKMEIIEL